MNEHSIREIARVAHEVNRAYCQATGDNSQPEWDAAPDWQQDSAINGVRFHLQNYSAYGRWPSPDQSHKNWMAEKVADGWTYGDVKDPANKTHPCMVPYSELPLSQRVKDFLFGAVVSALAQSDQFR